MKVYILLFVIYAEHSEVLDWRLGIGIRRSLCESDEERKLLRVARHSRRVIFFKIKIKIILILCYIPQLLLTIFGSDIIKTTNINVNLITRICGLGNNNRAIVGKRTFLFVHINFHV